MSDNVAAAQLEEIAGDFTAEELKEFLEADTLEVKANPEFKERLRRKLWDLVKSGLDRSPEPK